MRIRHREVSTLGNKWGLFEFNRYFRKSEANGHLVKHMQNSIKLNCPFEDWNAQTIAERLPIYNLESFAPAKSRDDTQFGQPNGSRVEG